MRIRAKTFAAVLSGLLVCPGCQIADLNGDGVVDMNEVSTAVENWFCSDSTTTSPDNGTGTTDGTGTPSTNTPSTTTPSTTTP